jgi:hypothetical protein
MGRARVSTSFPERNLKHWQFLDYCRTCQATVTWLVTEGKPPVIARCSRCTQLRHVSDDDRKRQCGEVLIGTSVIE